MFHSPVSKELDPTIFNLVSDGVQSSYDKASPPDVKAESN